MHSMPAADLQLSVTHEGMQTTVPVSGFTAGEIRENVVIALGQGVEVRGVVLDSDGNPVSRLGLYCNYQVGKVPHTKHAYTNAQGEFTLKNLRPGKGRISAHVSGRTIQLGGAIDIPSHNLRLTYDPPKEVLVTGTVVDHEGHPIPLCDVAITAKGSHRPITNVVRDGAIQVTVRVSCHFA